MKISEMTDVQVRESLRVLRAEALKANRDGEICRSGLADAFSAANLDTANEDGESFVLLRVKLAHDSDAPLDLEKIQEELTDRICNEFNIDDDGFDVEGAEIVKLAGLTIQDAAEKLGLKLGPRGEATLADALAMERTVFL